jgi:peptidoglycan/LPS O-acetylase OafA/YrhL
VREPRSAPAIADPGTAARRPAPHRAIRTDIQALRAFAVLAVVLFHIWPVALPGGYVGVDVFFVISGFLITGQLLRGVDRGDLRLGRFWAARARRLLPAALLVLLVSVALTLAWAPPPRQSADLRSIVASALYGVNWVLAADGVDYLAHDGAPPIAQHYWSLAVEEQFYLVWPLLILCVAGGAAGAIARRRLRVAAGVVAVAGFAACWWMTSASYPFGYFSTASRLWEFAVGAMVALAPAVAVGPRTRAAAWAAGVAGLALAVLLYGGDTPFPGPAAIVPTAATALLIALGPAAPTGRLDRLVAARPVQWLGDQSYGIYLWHWPLVVIAPHLLGRPTDLLENVALLGATILLAALSKRLVEDPIRYGRRSSAATPRRALIAAAAAMAVIVAAAAVPSWHLSRAAEARQAAVHAELVDPAQCRGASALLEDGCAAARGAAVPAADLVPSPTALRDDTGDAYRCYDFEPTAGREPVSCSFGAEGSGALRIALTGDSHAAMLIPALRRVATAEGWRIDTFVGRGCVWRAAEEGPCAARDELLTQRLLGGAYDVLLVTGLNSPEFDEGDRARLAEEYAAAWRRAADAGVRVLVVADNPNVPAEAQECIAAASSVTISTCAFPTSRARLDADPLRAAARASDAALIDLSEAYCRPDGCPMMLGGVLVYRDAHHITATFSQTLAPYLAERLRRAAAG